MHGTDRVRSQRNDQDMIVLVVLMIGHHERRRVYWAMISMKPADAIAAGKLIEDLK